MMLAKAIEDGVSDERGGLMRVGEGRALLDRRSGMVGHLLRRSGLFITMFDGLMEGFCIRESPRQCYMNEIMEDIRYFFLL